MAGVPGPLGQTCSQLCCRLFWCLQHAFVISTHPIPRGISQPNSPSSILGKALTAFALSLTRTACRCVHQSDTRVLLYPWRVDSGSQSLSGRWISLWRHLLTTEGAQDDEVWETRSHIHGPHRASHLGGQWPELCQYLIGKGGDQG